MNSEELAKQMEELKASMEEAKALLAPVASQMDTLNAQQAALDNKFNEKIAAIKEIYTDKTNEIQEQKKSIQQAFTQSSNAITNFGYQLDSLKYKYEQTVAEEKAAEEAAILAAEEEARNKALTEKWDLLTIGLPWREWAKEHQLTGADYLVRNRYVLLADVMGLGKTLTSIITCDKAERATKDASTEFPFLGTEKEVYRPDKFKHRTTGEYLEGWISYEDRKQLIADFEDNPNTSEYIHEKAGYYKEIVNSITRPVGRKVLYLCPASLMTNVRDEWRMWSKNRNVILLGGMTRDERAYVFDMVLPNADNFVVICNYEAWRRDKKLIANITELKFDTVIIDEAHNAKNLKSSVNRGINSILRNSEPEYILPMTGTPVLNKPQDLFAILQFINPEEFYNLNAFLRDYCWQNAEGKWLFTGGGMDNLKNKIHKNYLRRTKDEAGIQLPPKTVIHHTLEVDEDTYPDQARVREQMRKYATIVISEKEGKALQAAAMIAVFTRLRQIETWPAGIRQVDKVTGEVKLQIDVYESQKMDYAIGYDEDEKEWGGLIPEVIEDERVVVFSQFKAPLQEMKRRIEAAGYRAVVLDGDTPEDVKDAIRKDFDARHTPDRENSKWDVVLCNYRVGGVGFNFTAASQLIALDEEWNPGKRDQAFDRIDRMGQIRPTTVHVLRNKNTIDDWLAGIMELKEAMIQGFESTMTDSITGDDILTALKNGLI